MHSGNFRKKEGIAMLMYFIDKDLLAQRSHASVSFIKEGRLYTPKFCGAMAAIYLNGTYSAHDDIFIPVDMAGIKTSSITNDERGDIFNVKVTIRG